MRKRRVIRWVLATVVVVALAGAGVLSWHVHQERAYWRHVRAEMQLLSLDLDQWHPTRPEVLGSVQYVDAVSRNPIERRLVTVDTGGRITFLTQGHSDDPCAWSPDGKMILFTRQRHNSSRHDLELFRHVRARGTERDWGAVSRAWEKTLDSELAVLDATEGTHRVGGHIARPNYRLGAWLANDLIAAMQLSRQPPWADVFEVWNTVTSRRVVSQALPGAFNPVVLRTGPEGQVALEGGIWQGEPPKRVRSALYVRDQGGGWRELPLPGETVAGALQWLGPPANVLVTRQHLKVWAGSPMVFFWTNTQDWTTEMVTVPGFPGHGYKSGRWAPSGQAIALTASEWTSQRDGNQVLVLWKPGWQRPRLLHKGNYLTSIVWSPDGKQLAVGEDHTHLRFITIPQDWQ